MRRLVLAPALAALAVLAPSVHAAAPAPQVVDPSGDANAGANEPGTSDTALPAGNQAYADVVSVLWQTTKKTTVVKKKKVTTVTGFTVTATLSGPPAPPTGTTVVYRMLGATPACGFFGVAYYTSKGSDPTQPQSAIRDNCNGTDTRLTPIALPVIAGNTITWTVPMTAIPKDTKVKLGSKITGLWFEVKEIEDFHVACLPDTGQTPYDKACGLGVGALDNSPVGDATFAIA
jgi:hypothetical protein